MGYGRKIHRRRIGNYMREYKTLMRTMRGTRKWGAKGWGGELWGIWEFPK